MEFVVIDRAKNAADERGQNEIAATVAVRAEDTVKADLARSAEGRGDIRGPPHQTLASRSTKITPKLLLTAAVAAAWIRPSTTAQNRLTIKSTKANRFIFVSRECNLATFQVPFPCRWQKNSKPGMEPSGPAQVPD